MRDLKQRGLLEDTLVAWGGEFGRTPFGQGNADNPVGRDHFGRAYTWWLAGGGIKPGITFGETDDFGWNITADRVHVHDMQATLMHLCGIGIALGIGAVKNQHPLKTLALRYVSGSSSE